VKRRQKLLASARVIGAKTETAARNALALPVYPDLTEEQQRYFVEQIREFYHGTSGKPV
jgi:dTDP-4-amino-4,6-dideoxygalactose transaminase